MTIGPTSEFVRWRPAPPLRPIIARYIGYREAGAAPREYRGLPSPYLTLIVTLDDPLVIAAHPDPRTPPGRYDTLVGGLHAVPALIKHDGWQSGIQVGLSPLGARALLGLPAGELANADIHAEDVLGPFAAELRARVLAATGWAERFSMLDRLLLRRVDADSRPPAEVTRAWRRLVMTAGAAPMSALADEVGWSGRYLSRRFATEIGLSPKAAARVVRFDRARRLLQREAGSDGDATLAAVAATAGYYDQAHFARDFREFAGCPPSQWMREEFRNVQALSGMAPLGSAA